MRRISGETGENLGEPGTIGGAVSVRYPTSSIESLFVGHGLMAADTGSSRLVYAMVFALIVIGVVLIVLAIVVFRRTRVDLDVLAPLERMGSRKWRKGDPESRRQLLDAVRPAGATGPSLTESDDAPVGLPPPVIESDSEVPHDATFVAGPDGIEPVEHVEETEPVEDPEPAEGVEAVDPAPIAAEVRADAVAPADVVPVGEIVSSDDAVVASDDAGGAQDDAVVVADEAISAPDDVPAAPELADAASENAPDDGSAPTDDGVVQPAAPAEPVDGSVTGQ